MGLRQEAESFYMCLLVKKLAHDTICCNNTDDYDIVCVCVCVFVFVDIQCVHSSSYNYTRLSFLTA